MIFTRRDTVRFDKTKLGTIRQDITGSFMTKKFVFPASQYSVEADLVAEALGKLKEGDQVSYDDLSKAAGLNVRKHRNVLNSARRALQRDQQKVYKAVNGFGLIRRDNEQIANSGVETIKKIGKVARRGLKVVQCVDYDRLSTQGKVRHMVGSSLLNLFNHSSGESAIKKIAATTQNSRLLPHNDTLAALAGN